MRIDFLKIILFHLYVYQGILILLLWGWHLYESARKVGWGVVGKNGVNMYPYFTAVLPVLYDMAQFNPTRYHLKYIEKRRIRVLQKYIF